MSTDDLAASAYFFSQHPRHSRFAFVSKLPAVVRVHSQTAALFYTVAPQLLTTSNFIGPWYHAALLFSGLGSIVLLFGVLFSQQIREDLVRAEAARAHREHHLEIVISPYKYNI